MPLTPFDMRRARKSSFYGLEAGIVREGRLFLSLAAEIARRRQARFTLIGEIVMPTDAASAAILDQATVDVAAWAGYPTADAFRAATPAEREAAIRAASVR